ncbi:transposase domain-containing protein [Myxococcus sp. RHST-1-4]|nr:transposase domain-containing protein [Myxococcus sp. RHSTA-1-4]
MGRHARSPGGRRTRRRGGEPHHSGAAGAPVRREADVALRESWSFWQIAPHFLTREDGARASDTNNRSERELRRIAVGRKAWLFVGSDDHAQSAGHLFTLIATARLHRLNPEAYLRDLLRVLAHWPRERYLELAPKYWAATRARLVAAELDAEVGNLTIPEPLAPPSEEKQTSR